MGFWKKKRHFGINYHHIFMQAAANALKQSNLDSYLAFYYKTILLGFGLDQLN